VAGGLANGLSNGVIFGMGAVYANARGMSNAEISLFMGLVLLGGMLLQWPVGRISDLLDRRKVIIGVTALAAFLALIAGSFPDMPLWSLLVLTFLLGGMSLPMYSLCGSHLNDFLEPKQMVERLGGNASGRTRGFFPVAGVGELFHRHVRPMAYDAPRLDTAGRSGNLRFHAAARIAGGGNPEPGNTGKRSRLGGNSGGLRSDEIISLSADKDPWNFDVAQCQTDPSTSRLNNAI
jgi:hypothetical protein